MLKRYQVLLEDWQEEYIKFIAHKLNLNFSRVIKGLINIEAILIVNHLYPKSKLGISAEELIKGIKLFSKKKDINRESLRRFMSQCDFVARKAMELRIAKEKKGPRNPKKNNFQGGTNA